MNEHERFIIESLAEIKTLLQSIVHKTEDHELRLRSLERTKWLIAGLAAAGGGTIGSFLSNLPI